MRQLVLSAEKLLLQTPINQGQLDLSSYLNLEDNALVVDWKEFRTPKSMPAFDELIGKHLLQYPTQFIGRFLYKGKSIDSPENIVSFSSSIDGKFIHHIQEKQPAGVNCTWLIDLLLNKAKIETNQLRKDTLDIQENENTLELSLVSTDAFKTQTEIQSFKFDRNKAFLYWAHHVKIGDFA